MQDCRAEESGTDLLTYADTLYFRTWHRRPRAAKHRNPYPSTELTVFVEMGKEYTKYHTPVRQQVGHIAMQPPYKHFQHAPEPLPLINTLSTLAPQVHHSLPCTPSASHWTSLSSASRSAGPGGYRAHPVGTGFLVTLTPRPIKARLGSTLCLFLNLIPKSTLVFWFLIKHQAITVIEKR